MIRIRKSDERGALDYGWLDTKHTFSFGRYYDPEHMGFGALRVINEDIVAPGKGFGEHPHDNMEILTYIVKGGLSHRDSAGHTATVTPGQVQRMSAGTGITHSEFNASKTEPVHLLQIWIEPDKAGVKPGFEQADFPESERRGALRVVASPDGEKGSVRIHQNARVYATLLNKDSGVTHELAKGRRAWVQVVKGDLEVNGQRLTSGDGAAVEGEASLKLKAASEVEALVFDLA